MIGRWIESLTRKVFGGRTAPAARRPARPRARLLVETLEDRLVTSAVPLEPIAPLPVAEVGPRAAIVAEVAASRGFTWDVATVELHRPGLEKLLQDIQNVNVRTLALTGPSGFGNSNAEA